MLVTVSFSRSIYSVYKSYIVKLCHNYAPVLYVRRTATAPPHPFCAELEVPLAQPRPPEPVPLVPPAYAHPPAPPPAVAP